MSNLLNLITCGLILIIISFGNLSAQECKTSNSSFNAGEQLTYIVSYNWLFVWTEVGEIKMKIIDTSYKAKPAYYISGTGNTFKTWDWFFKVRDRYESYLDTQSIKPLYFKRDIQEGRYKQWTVYNFDFDQNKVYASNKVNENPMKSESVGITNCTFDVCSAIYYYRNLNFNKFKNNDTISLTVILDQELYNIKIIYIGNERIRIKDLGFIECQKYYITLVEGTVFKGNEHMTLWATNDKNHIPVLVESPIIVGSVKVIVAGIEKNRYPLVFSDKK